MWFNFGSAIQDIYKLYFDYYKKLHQLIFSYHESEINEFDSLLKGNDKDLLKKYYSCSIPENHYAEFILKSKING